MQDISRRPKESALNCAVVWIVAAMVGSMSGLLIADKNLRLLAKDSVSGLLERTAKTPREGIQSVEAPRGTEFKPPREAQLSKSVQIGLSSISALRYLNQSGSIHMDFDLKSIDLVGAGVLNSPNRIYVDLQEGPGLKDKSGGLKSQKTIGIDGDPVVRLRIAQWESGAVRLVLDLNRSCGFDYRILSGSPSHLILDVNPRVISSQVPVAEFVPTSK